MRERARVWASAITHSLVSINRHCCWWCCCARCSMMAHRTWRARTGVDPAVQAVEQQLEQRRRQPAAVHQPLHQAAATHDHRRCATIWRHPSIAHVTGSQRCSSGRISPACCVLPVSCVCVILVAVYLAVYLAGCCCVAQSICWRSSDPLVRYSSARWWWTARRDRVDRSASCASRTSPTPRPPWTASTAFVWRRRRRRWSCATPRASRSGSCASPRRPPPRQPVVLPAAQPLRRIPATAALELRLRLLLRLLPPLAWARTPQRCLHRPRSWARCLPWLREARSLSRSLAYVVACAHGKQVGLTLSVLVCVCVCVCARMWLPS